MIKYNDVFVLQCKTTMNEENEPLSKKEIIELGFCLLNITSLKVNDAGSVLIKPSGIVSELCTKRTGLTQDDVDSGVELKEAFEYLQEEFDIQNKPWTSYGMFCPGVLRKQCSSKQISYPVSDRFFDVKALFTIMFNVGKEVSMKEALLKLKISVPEAEGAEDEAQNTAILLKEILRGPLPLKL